MNSEIYFENILKKTEIRVLTTRRFFKLAENLVSTPSMNLKRQIKHTEIERGNNKVKGNYQPKKKC